MSKDRLKDLSQLQLSLYKKALSEAHLNTTINSPSLLSYSQKYLEMIPETFSRVNLDYFLDAMNRSHFVLYGDFHTLKQSQRGLLRLLRSFQVKYPKRHIILAMEMCQAKDQKIIDKYSSGEISDLEFLDATNYDKTWGFPWDGYKAILSHANQSGISVIGINKDESVKSSLEERDLFAAGILTKNHLKNPESLIVCLIGEFHLADDHLIAHLSKNLGKKRTTAKILRIITNVDQYSFQSTPNSLSQPTEYLHLKENLLCILNTPPWIKWKSYTLWEEMKQTNMHFSDEILNSDDDSDLFTEDTFDIDNHILNLTKDLAEFFNVEIKHSELSNFNSILFPDEDYFISIRKELKLTKKHIQSIKESVSIDGFFFIPYNNMFILSDFSLNNLSNAAG
ncbi:MAG: ChaN family lipoprotein, partial [Oligoflexales bacterium]|nr:ChaN family lipoprotein [Oligoflexales bacterium]